MYPSNEQNLSDVFSETHQRVRAYKSHLRALERVSEGDVASANILLDHYNSADRAIVAMEECISFAAVDTYVRERIPGLADDYSYTDACSELISAIRALQTAIRTTFSDETGTLITHSFNLAGRGVDTAQLTAGDLDDLKPAIAAVLALFPTD